jgi:hypothetical protein
MPMDRLSGEHRARRDEATRRRDERRQQGTVRVQQRNQRACERARPFVDFTHPY